MPYEHLTIGGLLRLLETECDWTIEFNDHRHRHWPTPDEAVKAAAHHTTDLPEWDQARFAVSDALLDWTPTGENL